MPADKPVTNTYADEFGPAFQFHLLAVCTRIADFVPRYRTALDPAYFAHDTDRLVAKALFAHLDTFHVLPHHTTLLEGCRALASPDELAAVEKALKALYHEDIADHPAVAAQAVNFGKTQAMANAVMEAAEELDRGNRAKIIPIIQAASMVGEDLLSVGLHYQDWPTRKQWYLTPPEVLQERVIPTGLAHLDYTMGGGLRRGELGVVLAPPKRGKTTLLINFGFGALTRPTPESLTERKGFNVLHLSLEMHQDDIVRRYDDRLAGPTHIKIKHTDAVQYVAHLERQQRRVLGDLYVKSYPTRSLTPTGIRALLVLLSARGFVPDLLLVDYADIMKPERRLGEMRHEQAGLYEDLRTIAGEFNLACWTGSQAGKGAMEKDVVTIQDFAEAFEKAAIVDCAIGFCQNDADRLLQRCRLLLAAYRSREDGRVITCSIRRDCCYVRSLKLYDPGVGELDLDIDPPEEAGTPKVRRVTTEHAAAPAPATATDGTPAPATPDAEPSRAPRQTARRLHHQYFPPQPKKKVWKAQPGKAKATPVKKRKHHGPTYRVGET